MFERESLYGQNSFCLSWQNPVEFQKVLVLCVMPTAMMQLRDRIKQPMFRKCVSIMIRAFIAFMVIGRLISGVHWLTDIIGGILLSAGLVITYDSLIGGKIHG